MADQQSQDQQQQPQQGQQLNQVRSQEFLDAFWEVNLGSSQTPIRPSSVLPANIWAKSKQQLIKQPAQGVSVEESYNTAVKECIAKVTAIVEECRRVELKYTDPHFDLDSNYFNYCLKSLDWFAKPQNPEDVKPDGKENRPACSKRVGEIFDSPQFFTSGVPKVADTCQGTEDDCWFLSAVNSICGENGHLVQKLCPLEARNEEVGVYGFVFFRDGEWISEVIDDKLYLFNPDYDDCSDDDKNRAACDLIYSDNLHGKCADQNETWLPLLEKAFAKAHEDYTAIANGFQGEGVEDISGGVTSYFSGKDILNVDNFWKNGFMKINEDPSDFLFGLGTKPWNYKESIPDQRQGIEDKHAYTVLRAVEYKDERLLMIKNPWGFAEWNGPWSDTSSQWTEETLKDLNYTIADDGIFWMPYRYVLERFTSISRTRLFDPSWKVSQKWITMEVPWAGDYNPTKFQFSIAETTRVVIVLSQLDDRYFKDLEGQYTFNLSFRLHTAGQEVHLVRGYTTGSDRSATTELHLKPEKYDVFVQLSAYRDSSKRKVEQIVADNWLDNRPKLMQIGLSYDLAQAKGLREPADLPKVTKNIPTASSSSAREDPTAETDLDANAPRASSNIPAEQVQDANGP